MSSGTLISCKSIRIQNSLLTIKFCCLMADNNFPPGFASMGQLAFCKCISKNFNAYRIIYILEKIRPIMTLSSMYVSLFLSLWHHEADTPGSPPCLALWMLRVGGAGVFGGKEDSDAGTKPYYLIISDDLPKDNFYRKKGPDFQDFYNLFWFLFLL